MDMNYSGGMWEGGDGQDGVEWGGEWDNCNSIINKYIYFLNLKRNPPKEFPLTCYDNQCKMEESRTASLVLTEKCPPQLLQPLKIPFKNRGK